MARLTKTHKKFPWGHVSKAARALGVSQGHLWHVLNGNRVSESLLQRFREWDANQTKGRKSS
jgi:hypothetical protein